MRPEDFQERLGLNADVFEKFKIYHALLVKWQKAINLVSPKTINDVWTRHFYDSAQMLNHIPKGIKTVADLGSGGGFPGLVLAILNLDLDMHLIESDTRKCEFLKTVSRETEAPVTIQARRIEDVAEGTVPNLVTARALAPVKDLLDYSSYWLDCNSNLEFLFLKGIHAYREVEDAHKWYAFNVRFFESQTENDAQIVHLKNVTKLDGTP